MEYERVCSKCIYGEYDEDHPDTMPSIFIYRNINNSDDNCMAWYCTCDEFISKEN